MQTGDKLRAKEEAGVAARRAFMRWMAAGSFALGGALVAGCANMKADPKRSRLKTHITGRGGANGK